MLRVLLVLALLGATAWAVSAQVPIYQGSMAKPVLLTTGSGITITDSAGSTFTVNKNSAMGLLAQAAAIGKYTVSYMPLLPQTPAGWHPSTISRGAVSISDPAAANWGVLLLAEQDYDPVTKQFQWGNAQDFTAITTGAGLPNMVANLLNNGGTMELIPADPTSLLSTAGRTTPNDKGTWVIIGHIAAGWGTWVPGTAPDQYVALFCKSTKSDVRVFVKPDQWNAGTGNYENFGFNAPMVTIDNLAALTLQMTNAEPGTGLPDHIGGSGDGSTSVIRFPDPINGRPVSAVLGTHTVQVSIPNTAYKTFQAAATMKKGKATRINAILTM